MKPEEIIALAREGEINALDIRFLDLFGGLHHITIPAKAVRPELFTDGVPFDGGSVPGLKSRHSGDMVLLPDPSTAVLDPFWEKPTLSVIGTVAEADTRKPFHRDTRGILARAEDFMRSEGIADESVWGPEYEFFVFDRASFGIGRDHAFYEVDCGEAWGGSPYRTGPQDGYHAAGPADVFSDLRQEITDILLASGISVKYHHHEVSACQQEIETPLLTATEAGDSASWIKYVVKQAAKRRGLAATFMPKPLPGLFGNGMHFHQLLRKNGKNLFYEKGGYADLSELAMNYIGGLLVHGRAITALTNPSTNSYRRLVPDCEAPVLFFFSLSNRSAAIRIPRYATSPEEKRIELRSPDATSNPYLAIAAQIMAGIDGIRKKINPTELGLGPHDVAIDSIGPEKLSLIPVCPRSLDEALDALAEDHEFLLAGDVFTEDIIQAWIEFKRREAGELSILPHPWEYEKYFGC